MIMGTFRDGIKDHYRIASRSLNQHPAKALYNLNHETFAHQLAETRGPGRLRHPADQPAQAPPRPEREAGDFVSRSHPGGHCLVKAML